MLKLNQQTVRNWIVAGKLPAHHIGRRVRVRRSDFDALLAAGYRVRGTGEPAGGAEIKTIWEGEVPVPRLP